MISPAMAAISCGIGALATLSAIAAIISSSVEASMDIRDIETNEHADGVIVVSEPSMDTEGTIHLNGYWGRSSIDISFSAGPELDEVTKTLSRSVEIKDTYQVNGTLNHYEDWPQLLGIISEHSRNVPGLKVVERSSSSANIKVFLLDEPHPEGKLGSAKLGRDKATFEIMFAEIRIYSASDLYEQGYIESVFKHELGHALGLGHATVEKSIMYSPLVIVENEVYADIGTCEFDATSSLYVDGILDVISCSNEK